MHSRNPAEPGWWNWRRHAGAALTIVGIGAISSRVWDRFDESIQVVVLGGLALVTLVAAALIGALTPGGVAALTRQPEAARRRLVGVLGVAGAGLVTGSVSLALQTYLSQAAEVRWMPMAFVVGLVVAAVTSRFVPGVVPTLAVCALLAASVMTAIDTNSPPTSATSTTSSPRQPERG